MRNWICRDLDKDFTLTCSTAKTETKMTTNIEQIATAMMATTAGGEDWIWSFNPLASAVPSMNAASLLNWFASSASCDNCFSAAMRRFPAGDELMQSPEKKQWKNGNLKKSFSLIHLSLSISILFFTPTLCLRLVCHQKKGEESTTAHFKQKQMTMLCRKWKWNSREIYHSCGGDGAWKIGYRKSGDRVMWITGKLFVGWEKSNEKRESFQDGLARAEIEEKFKKKRDAKAWTLIETKSFWEKLCNFHSKRL